MLEPLVDILPGSAELRLELGQALSELGEHQLAVAALIRAIKMGLATPEVWKALSEQLYVVGDRGGSDAASLRAAISGS